MKFKYQFLFMSVERPAALQTATHTITLCSAALIFLVIKCHINMRMTCGKYSESHFVTKEGRCYSLWAVMTVKPEAWVMGSDPGSEMCYFSSWLAEFPGLTSLEFAVSVKDWIFADRSEVWILLRVLWLMGSVVWGKPFRLSALSFPNCKGWLNTLNRFV